MNRAVARTGTTSACAGMRASAELVVHGPAAAPGTEPSSKQAAALGPGRWAKACAQELEFRILCPSLRPVSPWRSAGSPPPSLLHPALRALPATAPAPPTNRTPIAEDKRRQRVPCCLCSCGALSTLIEGARLSTVGQRHRASILKLSQGRCRGGLDTIVWTHGSAAAWEFQFGIKWLWCCVWALTQGADFVLRRPMRRQGS